MLKRALIAYVNSIKAMWSVIAHPLSIESKRKAILKDYRIYGNSMQLLLPSEYQQVEYIESTGEQYIDTGIIANQNTGFEIKFLPKNKISSSTTEYGNVFGARTKSSVNEYQLTTYRSDGTPDYQGTFRLGTISYDGGITIGETNVISLKSGLYTKSDGVQATLDGEFTSPCTITLFALNNNGTPAQHGSFQLFSFKLYDGDTLVRNFIPCYRVSDSVIGLYDIVNDVFYENAGTGEFLKGFTTPTIESPIEIQSVGVYDEELGNYKIPVVVSTENLLDLSKCNLLTTLKYGDYGIKQTRTSSSNNGAKFPVNLSAGTKIYLSYKFVDCGGSNVNNVVYMRAHPKDGSSTFLIFQLLNRVKGRKYVNSVTLKQDIKQVEFYTQYSWEVGSYFTLDNVKLTVEEPVNIDIYLDEPLRKVGEYADYINFENQKVIRNIKQETITEISSMSGDRTTYRRFTPHISEKPLKSGSGGNTKGVTISNKFRSTDASYDDLGNYGGLIIPYISTSGVNMVAITFNSTSINTVTKAQNAIGDGFDVCYALAEPVEVDIDLPKLPQFKGTTIYEIDTEIKPSGMEVCYYE